MLNSMPSKINTLIVTAGAVSALVLAGCSSDEQPAEFTLSDVTYQLNATSGVQDDDVIGGLRMAGVPVEKVPDFQDVTVRLASKESYGNPNAVNVFDSLADSQGEASDGHPDGASRGYLQLIPSIFASNHVDGTSPNIYNVSANVAAGWTYISRHYHVDLASGDGLVQFDNQYVKRHI